MAGVFDPSWVAEGFSRAWPSRPTVDSWRWAGFEPDITLLDLQGAGSERRLGMAIRYVKALALLARREGPGRDQFASQRNRAVGHGRGAAASTPSAATAHPVLSMAFGRMASRWLRRDDEAIIVWDLTLGLPRLAWRCQRGPVDSIVYSHHGGRLASVSARECCSRLWDLASGWQERTIRGRSAAMNSLAFSPDGPLVRRNRP